MVNPIDLLMEIQPIGIQQPFLFCGDRPLLNGWQLPWLLDGWLVTVDCWKYGLTGDGAIWKEGNMGTYLCMYMHMCVLA